MNSGLEFDFADRRGDETVNKERPNQCNEHVLFFRSFRRNFVDSFITLNSVIWKFRAGQNHQRAGSYYNKSSFFLN